MTTAIERIYEICEKYAYSQGKMEKELGFSNGYLNTTKKQKSDVGTNKMQIIIEKFPKISPEWLLTGRGDMLRNSAVQTATISPKGIPLIPLDAIGGFGAEISYQILESDIVERYVVPDFDRVKPDFLIKVKGSSMSPKYNSGDVIAIKRIPLDDFIQWNKPYVIDTETQGVLVKRIVESKKEGCFQLISDNQKYQPFDVPKEKIRSIFLVVGVIRLE